MNQDKAWQQFTDLPPEQQQEVLDFMAFLQARGRLPTNRKTSRRTRLAAEPFVGLWRNREDLSDSIAWVRKTRQREWKGSRG